MHALGCLLMPVEALLTIMEAVFNKGHHKEAARWREALRRGEVL